MSIADSAGYAPAISEIRKMAQAGVPIFVGRLTPAGDPDRSDRRWDNWQNTEAGEPSLAAVEAWKPGLAICAVSGIICDVIDIDPRNGGNFSLKRFNNELGDDGPETYMQVRTPSGGWHLYIAPLGIGGKNGFLPGMDLKGGKADGSSRGFVFLPPTVRPSKETGELRPYVFSAKSSWITIPRRDNSGQPMVNWLEKLAAAVVVKTGSSGARLPLSELKQACLDAGDNQQRDALLKYVHELERKGLDRDDITDTLHGFLPKMQLFDKNNPWWPAKRPDPDHWIKNLFHKEGTVIGDALPGELDGLDSAGVSVSAGADGMYGFEPLARVTRKPVQHLWKGYSSVNVMTLLDGEKGVAKSLIVLDLAARLSTGRDMPDGSPNYFGRPVNTVLFGEEDDDSILSARAEAAGADMSRIFYRKTSELRVGRKSKGGAVVGEEFALPVGAGAIGRVLTALEASCAVFDPINDFLDADTQTHNDQSVRKALRPLASELARIGVACWCIRHMNKASGADARMRGAGSTAFQNRARYHLAAGRLPESYLGDGTNGLVVLDANLSVRRVGVLPYKVVSSEVPIDEDGTCAPMLEWYPIIEGMTANEMMGSDSARVGRPSALHDDLIMALTEMFQRKPVWPAKAAQAELSEMGMKCSAPVLIKARKSAGIESRPMHRRGAAGVTGWEWYLVGGDGESDVKARVSE
jgi:hypothetical protein